MPKFRGNKASRNSKEKNVHPYINIRKFNLGAL